MCVVVPAVVGGVNVVGVGHDDDTVDSAGVVGDVVAIVVGVVVVVVSNFKCCVCAILLDDLLSLQLSATAPAGCWLTTTRRFKQK